MSLTHAALTGLLLAALPAIAPAEESAVYRHPSGFTMRYPATWIQGDVPDGVRLAPPELHRDGRGALSCLVSGGDADGAAREDDPRILRVLARYCRAKLPFLEPTGSTRRLLIPRSGAPPRTASVLEYAGASPERPGIPLGANVHVTLLEGRYVVLVATGVRERLPAYEGEIRRILASLDLQRSRTDTRLVGQWYLENPRSAGGGAAATERYLALLPDGSCRTSTRALPPDPDPVVGGSWTADGQMLEFLWPGGGEGFQYELSGRSLSLMDPGGRQRRYSRVGR